MPAPRAPVQEERRSPFLPLLILMGSIAVWTGFQSYHLTTERSGLAALRANQDGQVQQAQRVRQSLDQLATETQKLADAGNANARVVVEELRKRGVTINRPAQAPAESK